MYIKRNTCASMGFAMMVAHILPITSFSLRLCCHRWAPDSRRIFNRQGSMNGQQLLALCLLACIAGVAFAARQTKGESNDCAGAVDSNKSRDSSSISYDANHPFVNRAKIMLCNTLFACSTGHYALSKLPFQQHFISQTASCKPALQNHSTGVQPHVSYVISATDQSVDDVLF